MLKEQESGRSMIEMLGVLAVIGVLSVGGIAGYTSAMNKHRANELLHQVSMRAATCMAQISAGNTPSVSDFGDYDGYTFTAAANPSNANQFQLTISGKDIPEAVCNNMKNTVGSSTPVRDINANCTIITYNNDMGTTAYASDYKTADDCKSPFKWCSAASTPYCAEDCCAGVTLNQCQESCNSATGAIINKDDSETCDYTPGAADGKCDGNGHCLKDADGASCHDNLYLCVGTNAPYCVQQYTNGNYTLTCQKNPIDYIDTLNNTLCGEGFSGCGDLYCGEDGYCHSSLLGTYCSQIYFSPDPNARYCNPEVLTDEDRTRLGYYSAFTPISAGAYCNSPDFDCGEGYFCDYGRCCSRTNPDPNLCPSAG